MSVVLCILDGVGLNPRAEANAVQRAATPNLTALLRKSPSSTLTTFGERVGLPEGQMGNSEVGHLNLGGGRVIEQWLLRISRAFKKGTVKAMPAYKTFLANNQSAPQVHVIGLFSTGGVHSHAEHMRLVIEDLQKSIPGTILIHIILDGRDTPPKVGHAEVLELEKALAGNKRVRIASVSGRFFAMDRDKRWERVGAAYHAMHGTSTNKTPLASKWIEENYAKNLTDEFIEPAVVGDCTVNKSDGVLFYNFREDRMREIVAALCASDFAGFTRQKPPFEPGRTLCFTDYDHSLHLPSLFAQEEIKNHLGEWLAAHGKKQLRVAETEKYPHVTYFFNAGIEKAYEGEERTMIPSPRDVKTYDQKPEMSAAGVCDTVVHALHAKKFDFICVNFANGDMVGHTGNLDAATKAVEVVDGCLGRIVEAVKATGSTLVVLADHGNCEQMIDYETRVPFTSHTTYPVPVAVLGAPAGATLRPDGALCDVAPTILKLMNLTQPKEMTGVSLLR